MLSSEQIVWPIRVVLFGFGFEFPPNWRQCGPFAHRRSSDSIGVSVSKTMRLEAEFIA